VNHALRGWIAAGIVLVAWTSIANADAVVELRTVSLAGAPLAPPNIDGSWNGGESLLVELWMGAIDLPSQSGSLLLRSAQVNYAASPGLTIGQDIDAHGTGLDGIANFWFDYSSLPGGGFPAGSGETGSYLDFSNLAAGMPPTPLAPSMIYMGSAGGAQITLPAVQSPATPQFSRVGAMFVTLPAVQGTYTLDLLHTPFADDLLDATTISFGFGGPGSEDPFTFWSSATDDPQVHGGIAYADGPGPATFVVVPEPVTAVLVGLAAIVGLRRRKS